jgi:hypothetical protein
MRSFMQNLALLQGCLMRRGSTVEARACTISRSHDDMTWGFSEMRCAVRDVDADNRRVRVACPSGDPRFHGLCGAPGAAKFGDGLALIGPGASAPRLQGWRRFRGLGSIVGTVGLQMPNTASV